MLVPLPILLAFSSLAASAAIPPSSISQTRDSTTPESNWESTDLARPLSAQAANQNSESKNNYFAERSAYYFPETVPDKVELASHLIDSHEASDVTNTPTASEFEITTNQPEKISPAQLSQTQAQKSISTPDTEIDIPRARMLILPDRASNSGSDIGQAQSMEASYSYPVNFQTQAQPDTETETIRVDWVIFESSPIIISTPPIVPSLAFLFIIATIICIFTVVRGIRHGH
ncbi:hypothetical protein N7478_005762 [Penicillium angulare]|uniref:uncharacterized protein n=1 Tax=Penicillium angulare TaxID=116970 RepID=UPI00253F8AF0|nr:uncharacterized protein N7478_005762 [Penicillium angulare]KAJ5280390.1 hypothetical protein N7478_005762 [Penicillium angulare]